VSIRADACRALGTSCALVVTAVEEQGTLA